MVMGSDGKMTQQIKPKIKKVYIVTKAMGFLDLDIEDVFECKEKAYELKKEKEMDQKEKLGTMIFFWIVHEKVVRSCD